jgi:hypothetical protein
VELPGGSGPSKRSHSRGRALPACMRQTRPFDLADPSFVVDPYPVFAAMRRKAAVHWHPRLGTAVMMTHAACSAVLRHRSLGRVWADAEQAAADFTPICAA